MGIKDIYNKEVLVGDTVVLVLDDQLRTITGKVITVCMSGVYIRPNGRILWLFPKPKVYGCHMDLIRWELEDRL